MMFVVLRHFGSSSVGQVPCDAEVFGEHGGCLLFRSLLPSITKIKGGPQLGAEKTGEGFEKGGSPRAHRKLRHHTGIPTPLARGLPIGEPHFFAAPSVHKDGACTHTHQDQNPCHEEAAPREAATRRRHPGPEPCKGAPTWGVPFVFAAPSTHKDGAGIHFMCVTLQCERSPKHNKKVDPLRNGML